jgi:hypothetical protein
MEKYQPNRQFLLYKTDNGDIKVDVLLQNETIWMPQTKIAELFEVKVPAVFKHLKNIFESGELDEKVVVSILEITTQHVAIAKKTQDYAQDQAEQGNVMTMKDWADKLRAFLQFNQKQILEDSGKVTAAIAKEFAEKEFEKYKPIQDRLFESDFDKEIKKRLGE